MIIRWWTGRHNNIEVWIKTSCTSTSTRHRDEQHRYLCYGIPILFGQCGGAEPESFRRRRRRGFLDGVSVTRSVRAQRAITIYSPIPDRRSEGDYVRRGERRPHRPERPGYAVSRSGSAISCRRTWTGTKTETCIRSISNRPTCERFRCLTFRPGQLGRRPSRVLPGADRKLYTGPIL